jgi:hypothetical protein
MITLEELAEEFSTRYDIEPAAAREAVSVYTDQMIDDPRLYEYIEGEQEKVSDQGAALLRQQMSAVYGSGNPDIDDARDEVRSAVGLIKSGPGRRDAAIRAALKLGVPVKDVMADSGLSRQRLYQIQNGR